MFLPSEDAGTQGRKDTGKLHSISHLRAPPLRVLHQFTCLAELPAIRSLFVQAAAELKKHLR
ncbi:MAG TPA: hypothetical protein DCL61_25240 [Cyanobacteria bacterium UBA12227]|nr:hypothetical protein [Cyanobacteria bacterium UBA12227]